MWWGVHFYPRSPCGERQRCQASDISVKRISIHALLAESDRNKKIQDARTCLFLSTLSLRRATWPGLLARPFFLISIHALLAESDGRLGFLSFHNSIFLSTLSLRRATSSSYNAYLEESISIHALLAESDVVYALKFAHSMLFLSTLSLRRATISCAWSASKLGDFYPRSPCGERPK